MYRRDANTVDGLPDLKGIETVAMAKWRESWDLAVDGLPDLKGIETKKLTVVSADMDPLLMDSPI